MSNNEDAHILISNKMGFKYLSKWFLFSEEIIELFNKGIINILKPIDNKLNEDNRIFKNKINTENCKRINKHIEIFELTYSKKINPFEILDISCAYGFLIRCGFNVER